VTRTCYNAPRYTGGKATKILLNAVWRHTQCIPLSVTSIAVDNGIKIRYAQQSDYYCEVKQTEI